MEIQAKMENQAPVVFQGQRVKMVHLVHKDPQAQEVFPELKDQRVIQDQQVSQEMQVAQALLVPKDWMDCQASTETLDRLDPQEKMDHQVKLGFKASQASKDHLAHQVCRAPQDQLGLKVMLVPLVPKVLQAVQEVWDHLVQLEFQD